MFMYSDELSKELTDILLYGYKPPTRIERIKRFFRRFPRAWDVLRGYE